MNLLNKAFSEDGKKRYYYTLYTILFIIISLFAFSSFILTKTSFIYGTDGWDQHFKAYVFYGNYLRSIIKHLISEHKLVIPNWDFHIGEGSDILNALHYYVIGDPITIFSVFCPQKYMNHFYNFASLLRVYLSGVAFSVLCFGTGRKNRYAILGGAFSYAFCAWNIWNVARHPYFMNPLIYFPFLILGIEKIIKKEKPYIFIVSVLVSAISNVYFFYIIVLLTVIYTVVRLAYIYGRNIKDGMAILLRIGMASVLGVMMASALFLPVLMFFFKDSRLSMKQKLYMFYPLDYYSELPSILVSNEHAYWLCIGVSVPVLLAVFLMLAQKKSDRLMKIFLLIGALIVIFPIGGRLFNGMSYMNNRWSWVLSLLCAYILVLKWDELVDLNNSKEKNKVFIMCLIFYAICLFALKSRTLQGISPFPVLFIAVMTLAYGHFFDDKRNIKQMLLILVVAFSVINTSYLQNSPNAGDYVSQCISNENVEERLKDTDAHVVKRYMEGLYPRYTENIDVKNLNANIIEGVSNTQYYWSLSNPYVNDYRKSLEFREYSLFKYKGYDDRTTPIALSGTGYYITPVESTLTVPYGFELIKDIDSSAKEIKKNIELLKKELNVEEITQEQKSKLNNELRVNYSIYQNKYTLPLGYCYDTYISQEKWDELDPVQKQEIELDAALVDNLDMKDLSEYSGSIKDYEVPCSLELEGAKIVEQDGKYIVTSNDATATIKIDSDQSASETYFEFTDMKYEAVSRYDLYFGNESVDPLNLFNKVNYNLLTPAEKNKVLNEKHYWNPVSETYMSIRAMNGLFKNVHYLAPEGTFSSGKDDYIVNMGYSEGINNTFTVTFQDRGIYSFSDIKAYKIPMDDYENKVSKLSECSLEDVKLGIDSVKGKINTDKTRLLCMAISYADGWKGFVDGKEVKPVRVNQHYLGLVIPEGEHSVKFTYDTPYQKEGVILSLIGIAIFISVLLVDKIKIGKEEKRPKELNRLS